MVNNKFRSVCVVASYSLEAEPTLHNRLLPVVREFRQRGVDVVLVSPDNRLPSEFVGFVSEHITFKLSRIDRGGFIGRAIEEFLTAGRIVKLSAMVEADFYFVTIPSMFLLFRVTGLRVKRVILDVRDITWEYLSDKAPVTRFAKKLFSLWARHSFKSIDDVIVTNKTEMRYFDSIGLQSYLYTNGVTQRQFDELCGLPSNPRNMIGVKTVVYAGKIGHAQNLITLLDAMKESQGWVAKIAGDGPHLEQLREHCKAKSIENVRFLGKIGWNEVKQLYSEADVLYAQLAPDYSGAMPSKLYQYLCCRRIIVYGGAGQAIDTLSRFRAVYTHESGNVESLYSILRKLTSVNVPDSDFDFNQALIEGDYVRENSIKSCFDAIRVS